MNSKRQLKILVDFSGDKEEAFKQNHIPIIFKNESDRLINMTKDLFYAFLNKHYIERSNPIKLLALDKDFQTELAKLHQTTLTKVKTVAAQYHMPDERVKRFVNQRVSTKQLESEIGNVTIRLNFEFMFYDLDNTLTKERLVAYFKKADVISFPSYSNGLSLNTYEFIQELGLINLAYYKKLSKLMIKHLIK